MKARGLATALVMVCAAACGPQEPAASPPRAVTAAPRAAVELEVAPRPPEPTPEALAARALADESVTWLAADLAAVDAECRDRWVDGEVACASRGFGEIAARYQAHYGSHVDPRRDTGRIDALPRWGGA